MEKTSTLISHLSSDTHDFIQLQARSIKLELYERVTHAVSSAIGSGFIILFAAFSFLFVNLGLAFWLSEVFDSNKFGFLALGGFYFVILGLYLIFRHKIARNRVKNVVLHRISKDMNDYDLLLKEQAMVHAQIKEAELRLKENFEELKENMHTLKEDFAAIKGHFASHEEKHVGPKLPRIAITSAVDFVLQNLLFRKAGFVKRAILPLIANTLITSKLFHEDKKTSLVENLKLKVSKAL